LQGFVSKVDPEGTEPRAVASGTKTQPTLIKAMRHNLEIRIQSKSRSLLASLSRSLPRVCVKAPATARPLLMLRRGYDLQPRVAASATLGRVRRN